jgi:hypothetical protein
LVVFGLTVAACAVGCRQGRRPEGGGAAPSDAAGMFAPASVVLGFFTQSRDFDSKPGHDGLEVHVQPLDRFGHPTKAAGTYRVEVFESRRLTTEPRGRQLAQWFIEVLDEESNRRYYNDLDRSYVFPLLWKEAIEPGTEVIVQATYASPGVAPAGPGGTAGRLTAQRVIRIGGP